jgi:hypothetical protein
VPRIDGDQVVILDDLVVRHRRIFLNRLENNGFSHSRALFCAFLRAPDERRRHF